MSLAAFKISPQSVPLFSSQPHPLPFLVLCLHPHSPPAHTAAGPLCVECSPALETFPIRNPPPAPPDLPLPARPVLHLPPHALLSWPQWGKKSRLNSAPEHRVCLTVGSGCSALLACSAFPTVSEGPGASLNFSMPC